MFFVPGVVPKHVFVRAKFMLAAPPGDLLGLDDVVVLLLDELRPLELLVHQLELAVILELEVGAIVRIVFVNPVVRVRPETEEDKFLVRIQLAFVAVTEPPVKAVRDALENV